MNYTINVIQSEHDGAIRDIIKRVGIEFGAIGDGFGPSDPEVDEMSQHYKDESLSRYFVATVEGKIVGGGGVAPFNGSETVCELRKLFLLPESRGFGIGKKLSEACLAYAKSCGFAQCYLDTLANMHDAIALYKKLGFYQLEQPLDGTIHNGCDVWMLKELI